MKRLFFCFFLFLCYRCCSPSNELSYFDKGSALFEVDIDSALYLFQQGLLYHKSKKEWDLYVKCLLGSNACYDIKGDISESYSYTQQAYDTAKKYLSVESVAYGSCLNNLAIFASKRGDYEKAIPLFQKALKIEETDGQVEDEIMILNNLGGCFMRKGDYFEAKRYYNQALNTSLTKLDKSDRKIAIGYQHVAKAHLVTGELDAALQFCQKALNQVTPNPEEEVFWARYQFQIYLEMATIYSEKKMEKEIKEHIQQANHFHQLAFNRESAKAYFILGKWNFSTKNHTSALQQFEKAVKLSEEENQDLDRNPETGLFYYYLARVLFEDNNLSESLNHFQQALNHFTKEKTVDNSTQNLHAEDLFINQNLLKILQGKAIAEQHLFQKTKNKKHLTQSKATYQLAIDVLNLLRQSYLESGSKEILAENVLPIFEGALKVNYTVYQKEKTPERFNALFQIAENSKAILLLESINEATARGFAGIPDKLLDQERELKLNIAYHERQKALTPNAAVEKRRVIETGLFELKGKYQELIHTFEKEYPEYHQLKYDTKIATLQQVQKTLPNSQSALLEYFVGEKNIYLFCISPEKATVKQLEKRADFAQQIQSVRNQIIDMPSGKSAQKNYEKFTAAAHSLFQSLVLPADLDTSIQQLIIIPDDILAYLPFEVFLQNKASSSELDYSPQSLQYLLSDFQISYNYSATLFTQKKTSNKAAAHDFVGFAPSFKDPGGEGFSFRSCIEDQLYNLVCNEEEVSKISEIFTDGKAILGSDATKSNFLKTINNYRIAHFATHACLNEDNPMLHKIFLTGDYISNYDLYGLQLPTELVVLSACNTGSGKLSRGEGVMSLSRGFMHAGCPSVLMSLWAVEDCTTAAIMNQYYLGIKAGKTKTLALQEAKMNYLKNGNRLERHPFFWAPFVQIGDPAPVVFE